MPYPALDGPALCPLPCMAHATFFCLLRRIHQSPLHCFLPFMRHIVDLAAFLRHGPVGRAPVGPHGFPRAGLLHGDHRPGRHRGHHRGPRHPPWGPLRQGYRARRRVGRRDAGLDPRRHPRHHTVSSQCSLNPIRGELSCLFFFIKKMMGCQRRSFDFQ